MHNLEQERTRGGERERETSRESKMAAYVVVYLFRDSLSLRGITATIYIQSFFGSMKAPDPYLFSMY